MGHETHFLARALKNRSSRNWKEWNSAWRNRSLLGSSLLSKIKLINKCIYIRANAHIDELTKYIRYNNILIQQAFYFRHVQVTAVVIIVVAVFIFYLVSVSDKILRNWTWDNLVPEFTGVFVELLIIYLGFNLISSFREKRAWSASRGLLLDDFHEVYNERHDIISIMEGSWSVKTDIDKHITELLNRYSRCINAKIDSKFVSLARNIKKLTDLMDSASSRPKHYHIENVSKIVSSLTVQCESDADTISSMLGAKPQDVDHLFSSAREWSDSLLMKYISVVSLSSAAHERISRND